jgi:enoyl-CoA hydratase
MEHVQLGRNGAIAEITLDRPKVNAMSRAMLRDIAEVFRVVGDDPACAGALLRGAGSTLSAGLDLREVMALDPRAGGEFLTEFDAAFTAAFAFDKPLAVVVHGHAIAGGMVIALCADFMAMAEGDYKIGLTELAVGVPFPRVAWEIVTHSLPPRALRKLVNEAGTHPPAEIFALGAGDVVTADPVAAARSWLGVVTSRPLETFRFVKRMQREAALARIASQTLAERQRHLATLLSTRQSLGL